MNNQTNAAYFNQKAEIYNQFRQGFPPEIAREVQNFTNLPNSAHVLDVGAGTGLFTQTLSPLFKKITALDPNQEMINYIEINLPTVSTICAQAEETNLSNHSVDLITCARAFHWLDQPKAAKEWKRILKPPGWVAIIMTGRREDDEPLYAQRNVAVAQISQKFSELRQDSDKKRTELNSFLNITHQKEFPYSEVLTLETFIGREKSKAYFPTNDLNREQNLTDALTHIFQNNAKNNQVFTKETFDLVIGTLP